MQQTMLKINTDADYEKVNAWLLKCTCLFWLFAKVIGWRMFTTDRLFPTAPVFEILDNIPAAIHLILFFLSLLFLVRLIVLKKNKAVLWGLLIAEIFSCLLDQNRWQPWEYQYLFVIFIFIVNATHQKLITVAFTFILVSTYIYSGLGKLNEGFLQTIWAKMILHLFLKIPAHTAKQHWLYYSGYIAGLIELIAGTGLLFLKTRKLSACVLILMHLFILLLLGPFGLWYNKIVWPWNVAMVFYLYLIFLKKAPVIIPFKSILSGWNIPVFICWGILPALSFAGCWDNYLSSAIYSGRLPKMLICIKDTSKCKPLQKFCRKDLLNTCNGEAVIDLQYWAMTETNAAPYPELRVYKKIEKKLEKQYAGAGLSFVYFVGGQKQ
jgi:hypothetical protein